MPADSDYSTAEAWTNISDWYTNNVQRLSTEATPRLVSLMNSLSPITPSSRLVDVGAGTGAAVTSVVAAHPGASILATDISPGMIAQIDAKALPGVTTRVLDARDVAKSLGASEYTHALSTFMLQFIPHPEEVVQAMTEVVKPGGVVGLAIWGRALDPFDIWKQACRRIDPGYAPGSEFYDENTWYSSGDLDKALRDAGLEDVRTEQFRLSFPWPSSKAFTDFFFESENPGILKCMSYWKGDLEPVRREVIKIVDEEYGGGRDLRTEATIGVGKKSS